MRDFPIFAVVALIAALVIQMAEEAGRKMNNGDRYSTWSSDPPDSEGLWWIVGDEEFGTMGGNYTGTIPPEVRLRVVEVTKTATHLYGACGGRFISLTPFDKENRKPGYVGEWKKVTLPELPKK